MKKKIFWLIQSNQVTPIIVDFLQTLQKRIENFIDLIFVVPESSRNISESIKSLEPVFFNIVNQTATNSYQVYLAKSAALENRCFSEGLSFSDTLLLDDLGGGNTMRTNMDLSLPKNLCSIILQIPTPLGSSAMEEKIFQSTILLGRQNNIPVIGYELLPLDSRWTLAASLPDGIITRQPESCNFLKMQLDHTNIWMLPNYEASIFSSTATSFNLNGAKACYHYRNEYKIPTSRTVLYIPHNVAMLYEYRQIIKILKPLGSQLHLMFSIGEDQVRGVYSHREMVETIYADDLKSFASLSFHNMNTPWEMMMADAVVAGSACFNTEVAQKEIPCIIYDPTLPPIERGFKKRVAKEEKLLKAIQSAIKSHTYKNEIADILMLIAKTGHPND